MLHETVSVWLALGFGLGLGLLEAPFPNLNPLQPVGQLPVGVANKPIFEGGNADPEQALNTDPGGKIKATTGCFSASGEAGDTW